MWGLEQCVPLGNRPQAVCFCRDTLNHPCTYVNIEHEDTHTHTLAAQWAQSLDWKDISHPKTIAECILKNTHTLNHHICMLFRMINCVALNIKSVVMVICTKKIYDTKCPFPITQQQRIFLSSSTHSSSSQSDPWIRWSLHSTGMSSGRLFSGGASSWESACASISQSWGLPALEADARPAPPALPPALGHAWVSLCEAGGKKKRKSPHHTYSKLLSSTVKPICFSNYCRKKMACLLIWVWPIT